jgi:hypothetical protein
VHGELSSLEKLRQVEKLKSWKGKKAKRQKMPSPLGEKKDVEVSSVVKENPKSL